MASASGILSKRRIATNNKALGKNGTLAVAILPSVGRQNDARFSWHFAYFEKRRRKMFFFLSKIGSRSMCLVRTLPRSTNRLPHPHVMLDNGLEGRISPQIAHR